jgi:hypothetical protein
MQSDQAALNTWTAKQAARYGFTEVKVLPLSDGSFQINFTKGKK